MVLDADGTHCPRCGLRVAALPRRRRAPRDRPPRWERVLPDPQASTGHAVARGLAAGAAVDVAAAVLGLGARVVGASGRTVAGNLLVVVSIVLLAAALINPGVRIRRWGPPEMLRDRLEAAGRRDVRRTALLSAAAACSAGFLLAALLP